MPRSETPRLLFVHAHPDDECLTTGGTIARYAAHGAEVRVVTCTLGEEGEVIGDRYRFLAVDHADQLGGYRISELTAALAALGVPEPMFLGGPGRWRDSGMEGTPARRHPRFIDAGEAAIAELVAVIDRLRPHVVVTYDPNGGYGHPDHRQAHTVTAAAIAGAAWKVPKFYWSVMSTTAVLDGVEALEDLPPQWSRPDPSDLTFGFADDQIDAVIDTREQLSAKVKALAAHRTQVTVAPNAKSCALSNNVALPISTEEYYVLAEGTPGPRDARGWETDLLSGVNLG